MLFSFTKKQKKGNKPMFKKLKKSTKIAIKAFVDEFIHGVPNDRSLAISFNKKKEEILIKNQWQIVDEILIPAVIKDTYKKTDILITEQQAEAKAIKFFVKARKEGKIDDLNRLTTTEEELFKQCLEYLK